MRAWVGKRWFCTQCPLTGGLSFVLKTCNHVGIKSFGENIKVRETKYAW